MTCTVNVGQAKMMLNIWKMRQREQGMILITCRSSKICGHLNLLAMKILMQLYLVKVSSGYKLFFTVRSTKQSPKRLQSSVVLAVCSELLTVSYCILNKLPHLICISLKKFAKVLSDLQSVPRKIHSTM